MTDLHNDRECMCRDCVRKRLFPELSREVIIEKDQRGIINVGFKDD